MNFCFHNFWWYHYEDFGKSSHQSQQSYSQPKASYKSLWDYNEVNHWRYLNYTKDTVVLKGEHVSKLHIIS